MTKTNSLFLLVATFLLLSSCTPRISTSISKNYAPLRSTQEVKVIDIDDVVPAGSELLGEVKIGDTGMINNCNYEAVLSDARIEARKVGGNALKIVDHKYPDMMTTCHRIKALIYKVNFVEVAPALAAVQLDSSARTVQLPVKDTIQVAKMGSGYRFKYKGEELTGLRLEDVIQNNAEAARYFNKAKVSASFGSVLGYAGGFMIGWPIGTALGGGKANWTMAAIGCGLVVIAIPIVSSSNHNVLKAVNAFNQETLTSSRNTYYNITLGMNQSGLGLAIHF